MASVAFAGLQAATSAEHVSWLLGSLVPPPAGGVSFRVPGSYDAVIRIHHKLDGHESWGAADPDVDIRTLRELPYPLPEALEQVAGELGDSAVDVLVPALRRATTTPDRIHFAQWIGWGDLHRGSRTTTMPGANEVERAANDLRNTMRERAAEQVYEFVESCPHVEWWGGRSMFLFDGPIGAVTGIGTTAWLGAQQLRRRCPQWWWPHDRSWFVATEIDDPCSYVAGNDQLIDTVEQLGLDSARARHTDRW